MSLSDTDGQTMMSDVEERLEATAPQEPSVTDQLSSQVASHASLYAQGLLAVLMRTASALTAGLPQSPAASVPDVPHPNPVAPVVPTPVAPVPMKK